MMLPPSQPIRRGQPPDSRPIGRKPDRDRYDLGHLNRMNSYMRSNKTRHKDFDDPRFWQEVRAYASMSSSLRQRYFGLFVAVYKGNIVDSDPDETVLMDRFYRTFGYATVLIHAVGIEDIVVDSFD